MATEAFETIVEDFEFLEEWEERYRYVIELGRGMEPLEDRLKSDGAKVDGCASQVWIIPDFAEANGQKVFSFRGDSDAMIVRGLIALLRSLYNGLSVDEVLGVDARAEVGRLGLQSHLSTQRSNGLSSMIVRIRQIVANARASTAT